MIEFSILSSLDKDDYSSLRSAGISVELVEHYYNLYLEKYKEQLPKMYNEVSNLNKCELFGT